MTPREHLSNRRESESFCFAHDGVYYTATVSRFEDGSLAEMFLNAGKLGSAVHTMARDAAVVFSISRQCGVPLGILFSALAKLEDGSPAGPVGVAVSLAGAA